MRKFNLYFFFFFILTTACNKEEPTSAFSNVLENVESLKGKPEYLASPFVTAGDRVYMVGHQDGSFPDLGWHVQGEMGGIWNHPIKLMDGFTAAIRSDDNSYCLDQGDEFFNYPFANKHIFTKSVPGIQITRFQFVPEGQQGIVIEFKFDNVDSTKKSFEFEFTGHTDLMPVWLGEQAGMIDYVDNLTYDEKRNAWRGKDDGNEWYVLFGSNQKAEFEIGKSPICHYDPQGNGKEGRLTYKITLPKNGSRSLQFFIAGSYLNLQLF
jgi:hypothetical protein